MEISVCLASLEASYPYRAPIIMKFLLILTVALLLAQLTPGNEDLSQVEVGPGT